MRALALGVTCGTLGVLRLTAPPETLFASIVPLAATLATVAFGLAAGSARRAAAPPRTRLAAALDGSGRAAFALGAAPLALGAILGALTTLLACQAAAARVLDARLVGADLVVEGRVVGVPRRDGRRTRFELVVDRVVDGPEGVALAPVRLALGRYGGERVRGGERWQLAVRLRPLAGLRNVGGFDRARHALARGIDAFGHVRERPAPRRLAAGGGLSAWRERLAESLAEAGGTAGAAAAGASPDGGRELAVALAQALTLGIGDAVPESTRELLRESGTAHLLAISGLHVTLVAGWALWLGGALARRGGMSPGRTAAVALVAGLGAAGAYALLAGWGLPTRRALVMLAAVLLVRARARALPPGSALALALAAVLLFDPLAPLGTGFWLSFGTVAALAWLHAGRVRRAGAAARLGAIARTHLALGIVLLPATAWFFQSGAPVAPLANAVAVPLTALVIVPLAFASLALAPLWPAAAALALGALDAASGALLATLASLVGRLGSGWTLALPSLETLALCLAGLALLFAPRGLAPRALALVLLAPALSANLREPRVEGFEVHFLDVGQGLAALVLAERETWLYDTGGRLTPSLTMLEAVVVPYLHALGRREVDVVVVSHPDSDHAAGLAEAVRRWPGARVIVGGPTPGAPPDARLCRAGDTELVGTVRFSFLHPAAHDAGGRNDLSCVLLVHLGDSRALLTGDIEGAAEARLVHRLEALPVTLMSAPHHGSRTSSGEALLEALSPAHVVYPAGRGNAYGFPHEEVQMRYKAAGATAHVTGRDGALRFAFGPHGALAPPISWRDARHRFWHEMLEPSRPAGTASARAVPAGTRHRHRDADRVGDGQGRWLADAADHPVLDRRARDRHRALRPVEASPARITTAGTRGDAAAPTPGR